MADLIDRDALMKDLQSDCPEIEVCIGDESCIDCIVKRQPAVNRWIPCLDRLPEVDEYVLIFYPYWKTEYLSPVQVARLEYDGMFFDVCGEFDIPVNGVSHWMPLPEPPKEAEKNDEKVL